MKVMDAKISLKLLVDASNKRVLFAEAGKDFVDLMFGLLTVPIASVIKLLSPRSMVGCIGKLHQSVENLNDSFLLPNKKSSLLDPMNIAFSSLRRLVRQVSNAASSSTQVKYYGCRHCDGNFITTVLGSECPSCEEEMYAKMVIIGAPASTGEEEVGGYVQGVVTYMVTDDLEITPSSAISFVTMINKFGIQVGGAQMEEIVVSIGLEEGVALLEASLQSKTALTDVFFGLSSPLLFKTSSK